MARKSRGRSEAQASIQNAVKTLLANIRFASVDDPISTIVVTSSIPNEGKSTVSINLAQAIATSGRTCLLVETDMRRRTLAGRMNVHPQHGLYSVLAGEHTLAEAVVPTQTPRLYFLDAEPHIPNPADILASRRFHNFVSETSEAYDYVIFDTPPVGPFVDAAVVSAVADGTVLVVRERFVKRADLVNAVDQLHKAEANIIGTVLNCVEAETNDYYYAYYTKDGKRVDTAPAPVESSSSDDLAAPSPRRTKAARARAAERVAAQAQQPQPSRSGGAAGVAPARRISPDSTAAMVNMFQSSRRKQQDQKK